MRSQRKALVVVSLVLLAIPAAAAFAGEITVADIVPPFSLDQPRMSAVLFDGDNVITAADSEGTVKPVVFDAFIDTGASGSVISNLHVTGYPETLLRGEILPLGFTSADYIGSYTETGVGGNEVGDVSRAYTVKAINGCIGVVDGDTYLTYASDFASFNQHNLWVRRAPGTGELVSMDTGDGTLEIADPINILGMPVINQKVMYMDPTPLMGDDLFSLSVMNTHLLPSGSPDLPTTHVTLAVRMQNFMPTPLPSITPTHADNPMLQHVGASFTDGLGTKHTISQQEWLLDTGAGNSFISRDTAQSLGIIPAGMSLADFIAAYKASGGQTFQVGGVGAAVEAPLVTLDELRIATKDGQDELVWKNVDLLILDAAGLPGVFGMNMLVPSVSLNIDLNNITDISDLLAIFDTRSPGPFTSVVFDPALGELRLETTVETPEPATLSLLLIASAGLLMRRKRLAR